VDLYWEVSGSGLAGILAVMMWFSEILSGEHWT
jgi:hypothetical protein